MRQMIVSFVSLAALLAASWLATPAMADWDPGDGYKMHFPQLPDLKPTGLNVYASDTQLYDSQLFLADDWRCTGSGPVTDIHIWGSWLGDAYDHDDPGGWVGYHLFIFDDIPANESETGYSMPGEMQWEGLFAPPDDAIGPHYSVRLYGIGTEGFYDPKIDQIIGNDTKVWQYNFLMDEDEAFKQELGRTYWLGVQAVVDTPEPMPLWGWKTSLDHWNDNAVWGEGVYVPPGPPDWNKLRYPDAHPLQGDPIDLAFVITPEPSTLLLLSMGALSLLGYAWRRRATDEFLQALLASCVVETNHLAVEGGQVESSGGRGQAVEGRQ